MGPALTYDLCGQYFKVNVNNRVDFDFAFNILTALKGWVGHAPQGRGALQTRMVWAGCPPYYYLLLFQKLPVKHVQNRLYYRLIFDLFADIRFFSFVNIIIVYNAFNCTGIRRADNFYKSVLVAVAIEHEPTGFFGRPSSQFIFFFTSSPP